jgi:hypothetical protein
MPAEGGPVSVVGARLVNVSPFGMMIESLVPLEEESLHRLRLVVAGRNYDAEARVAACTARPGPLRRVYGIGMEFRRLAPEARAQLKSVLSPLVRNARRLRV